MNEVRDEITKFSLLQTIARLKVHSLQFNIYVKCTSSVLCYMEKREYNLSTS